MLSSALGALKRPDTKPDSRTQEYCADFINPNITSFPPYSHTSNTTSWLRTPGFQHKFSFINERSLKPITH